MGQFGGKFTQRFNAADSQPIVKELQYRVRLVKSFNLQASYVIAIRTNIQTNLHYKIYHKVTKTHNLQYSVRRSVPATKGLEYRFGATSAIPISLKYAVAATKQLRYYVFRTATPVVRNLKYYIPTTHASTKLLSYNVVLRITKGLTYSILPILKKSLRYVIYEPKPTTFYLRTTTATGAVPNAKQSGDTITTDLAAATATYAAPAVLSKVAGSNNVANEGNGATTTDPHFTHYGTWISNPLTPVNLTGTTVTVGLVMCETNAKQNNYAKVYIYVWKANDTKGSDLLTYTNNTTEIALTYPSSPVVYVSTQTLASVTLESGDRIAVEIESSDDPTESTARVHGLRYGGAAGGGYGSYLTFSAGIGGVESFTKGLQYYIRTTRKTIGTASGSDIFTTVGSDTWTRPSGIDTAEVLVVAGGGQGGCYVGGGGGAGGLLYQTVNLTSNEYSVVVGAGGTGGTVQGNRGQNSSFGDIVTTGGGGGAYYNNAANDQRDGGSGGGGAGYLAAAKIGGTGVAGPPRQGYDGGDSPDVAGSGGGGAGEEGHPGEGSGSYVGGDGGAGVDLSAVFGTDVGVNGWFAGGGGAGWYGSGGSHPSEGGQGGGGAVNVAGVANTGGGGGGYGATSGSGSGAAGGSGVVIVHYHSTETELTFYIAGSDALAFRAQKNLEYSVLSGGATRIYLQLKFFIEHTTTKELTFFIAHTIQKTLQFRIVASHKIQPPTLVNVTYDQVGSGQQWTVPIRAAHTKVLIVAGGGGGGNPSSQYGGGGGAGGARFWERDTEPGQVFSITVGAGGPIDTNGSNSSFDIIVSTGGGRGGVTTTGFSGGSGGGGGSSTGGAASPVTDPVQGYAGGTGLATGWGGGGGGGAGALGGNAVDDGGHTHGGAGGIGIQSDITGTLTYYAGGGAGHGTFQGVYGQGVIGRGGEGGFSGNYVTAGNNGIVIVAYTSAIYLRYRVIATPTPKTKNLDYDIIHKIAKSLSYRYITIPTPKVKNLDYDIARLVQKTLQFTVLATLRVRSGPLIVKEFTTVGSTWWVPPRGQTGIQYLVIGGGGGGGYNYAGGGGAGGVQQGTGLVCTKTVWITIGAGGNYNANGGDTSFYVVVAKGGGHGGGGSSYPAESGGSGGGGNNYGTNYPPGSGTSGQGYRGGYTLGAGSTYCGAGGGGAGGVGGDATVVQGGAGGSGITSDITGTVKEYAGGGGGGCYQLDGIRGLGTYGGGNGELKNDAQHTAGAANTGGGGGGGCYNNSKAGGSGIVIVRYPSDITLTYRIVPEGTYVIPRLLTYRILALHPVATKSLQFRVWGAPVHKTKSLTYAFVKKQTKDLKYKIRHLWPTTKLSTSYVKSFPHKLKSLEYEVIYNRATVTKYLTLSIYEPSIHYADKYLTYDIHGTYYGGRLLKGLRFTISPGVSYSKWKYLAFSVRKPVTQVTRTSTLQYKIWLATNVIKITKSLQYVIFPAPIIISVVSKVDKPEYTWVTFAATPNHTYNPLSPYVAPTWYWKYGDGVEAQGGAATTSWAYHGYTEAGAYSATAYAYLGTASTSASVSFNIEERSGIYVWFEADPVVGTFPLTVQFTNLSVVEGGGGGALRYLWYFGDNTSSTEKNPTHVYTVAKSYDVTLWAFGTYDSDTVTRPKLINCLDPPVADFEVLNDSMSDSPDNGYKVVLTVTDILGRVSAATKYVIPTEGLHFTRFRDKSTGYIVDWHWDYGDRVEDS